MLSANNFIVVFVELEEPTKLSEISGWLVVDQTSRMPLESTDQVISGKQDYLV